MFSDTRGERTRLAIGWGIVPERWSLVYFNKADRHVNVGPLKEFVSPEMEPVYEDLTALEYQSMRNAVHYPEPTSGAITVAG